MRKVLLAVDLATDAEAVIARAVPWIERLDAVADLVFVDLRRALDQQFAPPGATPEREAADRATELALTALLLHLPAARRGQALVDATTVDEMIEARSPGYALVLVGTRGRKGLAHAWLGSAAERIVRFSKTSVLVVREQTLGERVGILFAVDPAEPAEPLADALAPLALQLGGRVDLLTMQEIPTSAADLDEPLLYTHLARQADQLQMRLDRLLAGHFPESVRGTSKVEAGFAVDGIVRGAGGADLVVVGTHGRTGIAHAMLGSVAERVVRRAPGAVLVLRPQ